MAEVYNQPKEIERLTKELRQARAEIGNLRAAFRVNMLRYGATDAEIDQVLAVTIIKD